MSAAYLTIYMLSSIFLIFLLLAPKFKLLPILYYNIRFTMVLWLILLVQTISCFSIAISEGDVMFALYWILPFLLSCLMLFGSRIKALRGLRQRINDMTIFGFDGVLSLLVLYLFVLIFIYINQRNLLYHPTENNYLDDKIEFNHEEVLIETDKNIKLKSWLIIKDLKKYKTLIFFHGNAGNLFNRVHKLNELNKLDINILIISWRGFSGNPGKPTEKNLYHDAKMSIKWLNNLGINNDKIILYGESLGTGVAIELGQKDNFNGIILESPFTSVAKAAKIYYPYLPVNLLLKDRYDSINKINKITNPVLIMHGMKDDIVPYGMGVELFQKANQPKYSYFPENDNHMMDFNENLLDTIKVFINNN